MLLHNVVGRNTGKEKGDHERVHNIRINLQHAEATIVRTHVPAE